MNRILPVYQLTKSMKEMLSQEITSTNREEIIDLFQKNLEKRGELIELISPPYTSEEEEMGRQIVEMNQEMEKKMNRLFLDLKNEMKQMKQQRKSATSYTNPYTHLQTSDGMFLDQKK